MYESDRTDNHLLNFLRPTNTDSVNNNDTALEEYSCKRGDVNLHLLICRKHRNMRVLDYRIGNYQLKRNMLDFLARDRGLRKVYTLVEKQDSNSWRTVGFSREAVLPAFFRTADAYVMSRVYDEAGRPLTGGLSKVAVSHPIPLPDPSRKPSNVRFHVEDDAETLKDLVQDRLCTDLYTPFGKGMEGPDVAVRAKMGKKEFWVVAEINDSFGHAKLDFMTPPNTDREKAASVYASMDLFKHLLDKEVANVFGFTAVDDDMTGMAFGEAGFRHTGQLTRHISTDGNGAQDMHVWHRRLKSHRD
jgi:hypothetical protein